MVSNSSGGRLNSGEIFIIERSVVFSTDSDILFGPFSVALARGRHAQAFFGSCMVDLEVRRRIVGFVFGSWVLR